MRIILVGDFSGISQLLSFVPKENVKALMASGIRPQYLNKIQMLAEELNIALLIQPKWKSSAYTAFVEELAALRPDILWINSYSMIIRPDVLAIPTKGVLNIHGALLPNNRGSNPIQWAIINRQYQTGVTLHEVDSGLDSGPIIDQISVPIAIADTWVDVRNALVAASDTLIQNNLNQILQGNWKATAQNEALATFGPRRKEEDGCFTWSEPIIDIYNKIRALLPPIPAAFYVDERGIKQPMEDFQTMWQITASKYKRNLLPALSLNQQYQLRPIDAAEKATAWTEPFANQYQFATMFEQLNQARLAPDFVPFEICESSCGDVIGFAFLYQLDAKGKTMQAHLGLHDPSMHNQEDVNAIIGNISDFAKAEYGVAINMLGFGEMKAGI